MLGLNFASSAFRRPGENMKALVAVLESSSTPRVRSWIRDGGEIRDAESIWEPDWKKDGLGRIELAIGALSSVNNHDTS